MEKIERGGMRLNRWATSNGNGGMLRVAYEEKLFTYEDIIRCIEVLRTNGDISATDFLDSYLNLSNHDNFPS